MSEKWKLFWPKPYWQTVFRSATAPKLTNSEPPDESVVSMALP